jgi:hypothetical protein
MATAIKTAPRLNAERKFFMSMAVALIALIITGFAPTWYLRPWLGQPTMLSLTPLVWLHGIVFTGWATLFIVQVGLVSAGRTEIHRRLGLLAFGFAAALAPLGIITALYGALRASGPPEVPPLSFLALPLFTITTLVVVILFGLAKRRNAASHKRLMMLAMILSVAPGAVRIPIFPGPIGFLGVPSVFILALVIWDRKSRGKVLPATCWGGLAAFLALLTPLLIWTSAPWLSFARWATGLIA